MSRRWIDVPWKCKCMSAEATLQIKERAHGEDVLDFMERVQRRMGAIHRELSPLCRATKVEYVKIPVPPDGTVGGAEGGTA